MACRLTAAECFHKYVVANERVNVIRDRDTEGWYTVQHPGRGHGAPLRMQAGKWCHIFYTEPGNRPGPEAEVFAELVRVGMPGDCLKRPKGGKPEVKASDDDNKLADVIMDIAMGAGTTTERMVAMFLAGLGGQLPEGPMVGVFAERLRVSERTFYRVTAEVRRRHRAW